MPRVIIGDNCCSIGTLQYGQAFSVVVNTHSAGLQVSRELFCFAVIHDFTPRMIKVVNERAAKISGTTLRPEPEQNRITMTLPLIGASQMFAPALVQLSTDVFLDLRRAFLEYQAAAAEEAVSARIVPRRGRSRSHR